MSLKLRQTAEFGDFQTPDSLAVQIVRLVRTLGASPATVLEPSCGRGSFLAAAAREFPEAHLFGLDVSADHLATAAERLGGHPSLTLRCGSFFHHDWRTEIEELGSPILVLGNPPWVTNASLGAYGSYNLPEKTNFQNLNGIDAITGKSNFDISEWMLLQNISWLLRKTGELAVLCKSSVARKVLAFAWTREIPLSDARMYRIDAAEHFGAAVEACLLFLVVGSDRPTTMECAYFDNLADDDPSRHIGFSDETLISDIDGYRAYDRLRGSGSPKWRSGVKHDCAKIMELERHGRGWRNGLGDIVRLEENFIFPLVKSSDVANPQRRTRPKFVIVTQRAVGEDTARIRCEAPLTWSYLCANEKALRSRTSAIYKNKPRFSMFGIGDYSFAPWKVAISGLYKRLQFRVFGPVDGKPVFFDDTVYFLPFESKDEALNVAGLLDSEPARTFLSSMIFWDEKRPITAGLLRRLDIAALTRSLKHEEKPANHPPPPFVWLSDQLSLL